MEMDQLKRGSEREAGSRRNAQLYSQLNIKEDTLCHE